MQFNLEEKEINFILQVLGNLPTSSGVFPLVVKLQHQLESQKPETEVKSD